MTRAAGNDGEIQFNQCGSLGASDKLTWDRTNSQLNLQKSAQITGDSIGNQLSVNCNLQTDNAVGIQGSYVESAISHTGSNPAGLVISGSIAYKDTSHTYKLLIASITGGGPLYSVTVQRYFDGVLESSVVHTVNNGVSTSPTAAFNNGAFTYMTSIQIAEIVVNDYWEWQVDVLNPLTAVNCDSNPMMNINNSGIVVNEAGEDLDTRIEGDSSQYLLVCDASLNAVQIGTTAAGTIADFRETGVVFNESSNDMDFRVESNTYSNMLIVDGGNDQVQIGTSTAGTIATFENTGIVFNEDSQDRDFRVESDGNANMLTVNGGLNCVGIGKDPSSGVELDVSGDIGASGYIKSSSSSLGVGYATSAGGTVTQTTSKSTSVTVNKICGSITTHNATLNSGIRVSFTVNNNTVASTDVILLSHASGGTSQAYAYWIESVAAGSFAVTIYNVSASNLGEAITFNFSVIKSVTS